MLWTEERSSLILRICIVKFKLKGNFKFERFGSNMVSIWTVLYIFVYNRACASSQSTYIRVPQCLSPRPNWDPPPPLPQESVSPRDQRGGHHSPAGEEVGGGGPKLDDWRKSLALCLICGESYTDVQQYRYQKNVNACDVLLNFRFSMHKHTICDIVHFLHYHCVFVIIPIVRNVAP
jgi:hypothetical protein